MQMFTRLLTLTAKLTAFGLLVWLYLVWLLTPLTPNAIGLLLPISIALVIVCYVIGRGVIRTAGFIFHLIRSNI